MQKKLKTLSALCFGLLWIPFAIVMFKLARGEFESDPSGVLPEGLGLWIILLMSLAIGGFVFFIASLVVGSISNSRILKNGQLVKAKILAISDSGTRINKNPVLSFSLEVQSPDQGTFAAEAQKLVSIVEVANYKAGNTIDIKYLPGTKKVAIL